MYYYIYASVLWFSQMTFSNGKGPTMKALSGEPLRKQPDKLSAEDALQALLLYGCSGLIENYMDNHCHSPNMEIKWILDVLTSESSKT